MRNLALLALSLAATVLVGEFILRLAVDELNYLRPTLKSDAILGHAVVPGSAGHDEWGFRNNRVPDTAGIVAIGDSQTYGVSAPANQSWPALLEKFSGTPVYNLGLGGYGPAEYTHLLETKATKLTPHTILVGLYLGNDISDSYESLYGESKLIQMADQDDLIRELRDWLSSHSLTYQVAKHELDEIMNLVRYKEAVLKEGEGQYRLEHPILRTVFTPEKRHSVLDLDDPINRQGLEITLRLLARMAGQCVERDYDCLVVIIPTKESVYWPTAEHTLTGAAHERMAQLSYAEDAVRLRVVEALNDYDLRYVDVLGAMRRTARRQALYDAGTDGHPNPRGHAVIAQSVLEALRTEKNGHGVEYIAH